MGKKKVLVSYGVDIDAVAGSPSSLLLIESPNLSEQVGSVHMAEKTLQAISVEVDFYVLTTRLTLMCRRTVGWHSRNATSAQALRQI
jgi:hypothetical protein